MTRKDLVNAMAFASNLKKSEAAKCLDVMLSTVTDALARGESITLSGFGSFQPKSYPAKIARNPRTGERVDVPAKRVVKFRPGRPLNGSLNS